MPLVSRQSVIMAEESAFLDKDVFDGAKEKLGRYLEELPSEKGGQGTVDAGLAGVQLADGVCGVMSTTGGAVHPYRLVTGIISRLLKTYPSFWLYTHALSGSMPNTSSTLPTMDVPPPRANAGKDRSRT
ncbi:uncharacterized protein ARMOST_06424 [Armillaria ostoyae]|uniref:Uncharacterized protein n=1 Tax=Armillaria ostoyae TaxID=47428 RepID=A0A284R2X4_ARMOS|nr:uncharacterized protein ARMOST_06424 [Armillaria ostoyae]